MSCWYIKPATLFLYHFHEAKFLILGISQRLWPGLPMDSMCVFGRILVLKLLKMCFSSSLSFGFCISDFSHPSVIHLSLPFGTLTTSVDILLFESSLSYACCTEPLLILQRERELCFLEIHLLYFTLLDISGFHFDLHIILFFKKKLYVFKTHSMI